MKDSEGKPVAGATVVAGAFTSKPNHQIATTGADGRFAFQSKEGERKLDYVLAYKEGLAPASKFHDLGKKLTPSGDLELDLLKPEPFVGTVRERDGSPIAGARVEIKYMRGQGRQVRPQPHPRKRRARHAPRIAVPHDHGQARRISLPGGPLAATGDAQGVGRGHGRLQYRGARRLRGRVHLRFGGPAGAVDDGARSAHQGPRRDQISRPERRGIEGRTPEHARFRAVLADPRKPTPPVASNSTDFPRAAATSSSSIIPTTAPGPIARSTTCRSIRARRPR